MAKKEKKIEIKQGLAEWMGTYGDMVTLLLCFFVLMFASSDVNVEKFMQIASSFTKASVSIIPEHMEGMLDALGNGIVEMPQVKGDSDKDFEIEKTIDEELNSIQSDFNTYFQKNNLQDFINVEKDNGYVTLSFKDGILFDSGKANLKPESLNILSKVADKLKEYYNNDIRIEGHTDNMPIQTETFPNNWYLSAARAISVATYLIDNKKFDPNKISTEGYGEYKPKVPNDTPQNRSINRRVEIKIMNSYSNNNYN